MLPIARSEKLTIQEMPEETLIFDHQRNKAHCLNRVTALIWKHCDGRTSSAELARLVGGSAAIVDLALEQLASRHLLEGPPPRISAENRRTRRELLRKLAVAAAALPAIITVAAPRAASAASFSCKSNADCAPLTHDGCEIGVCSAGKCAIQTLADTTPCTVNGRTGICIAGGCATGIP